MWRRNNNHDKDHHNCQDEHKMAKDVNINELCTKSGFMANGIIGAFRASIDKMKNSFVRQLVLGIFAGILIGFGYTTCIYATKDFNEGQKAFQVLIWGFIFPTVIVLITFLGGGLYTSHVFAFIPALKKTIKFGEYLKGIYGCFLGNFLGIGIFVALLSLTGIAFETNYLNSTTTIFVKKLVYVGKEISDEVENHNKELNFNFGNISTKAILLTIVSCIASGLLCNCLVSSTLCLTSSTKNHSAELFLVMIPIIYFAIIGLQHAPANTYFFWIILVNGFKAEEGVEYYNYILVALLYFGINIIPSMIGNWISGAIIIPGTLYYLTYQKTNLFFVKYKEDMMNKEKEEKNHHDHEKK